MFISKARQRNPFSLSIYQGKGTVDDREKHFQIAVALIVLNPPTPHPTPPLTWDGMWWTFRYWYRFVKNHVLQNQVLGEYDENVAAADDSCAIWLLRRFLCVPLRHQLYILSASRAKQGHPFILTTNGSGSLVLPSSLSSKSTMMTCNIILTTVTEDQKDDPHCHRPSSWWANTVYLYHYDDDVMVKMMMMMGKMMMMLMMKPMQVLRTKFRWRARLPPSVHPLPNDLSTNIIMIITIMTIMSTIISIMTMIITIMMIPMTFIIVIILILITIINVPLIISVPTNHLFYIIVITTTTIIIITIIYVMMMLA